MRALHVQASRDMATDPAMMALAEQADAEPDEREDEWREACTIRARWREQRVREAGRRR